MEKLENEIKDLIITVLELEDLSVEDLKSDQALFGDEPGLDSIDALELGIAIKKKYDVSLAAEDEDNKKYFYSVKTLAEFVSKNKKERTA